MQNTGNEPRTDKLRSNSAPEKAKSLAQLAFRTILMSVESMNKEQRDQRGPPNHGIACFCGKAARHSMRICGHFSQPKARYLENYPQSLSTTLQDPWEAENPTVTR